MHTALNLPYVYDYITKLCRKQTEVIRNHENGHFGGVEQGEARHIHLEAVKLTTIQVTRLLSQHKICKIGMICSAKPVLTEELCVVQEEEVSITCCMCEMYT
jgi:hypothetical protein